MWQFYVLLVMNSLSLISCWGYFTGSKSKTPAVDVGPGLMLFFTLLGGFGLYLSYSLFLVSGTIGLMILVFHWASVIYYWLKMVMTGKTVALDPATGLFNLLKAGAMVVLLIYFGTSYLW